MQSREHEITKVTLIGSLVNGLLTLGKILAGIMGHSGAMLADGLHSLSDFISDIVVVVCVRISSKGQDEDHDYGHGKYETLATLCIGLLLILVGIELLWNGANDIYSFIKGEPIKQPELLALWAALLSIGAKEALYHYTSVKGKALSSPVVVANAWHHRTDALSSIGSAIGISGAVFLGDKWVILDPIACCIISVFILVMAFQMAGPSLQELLEASLSEDMENDIITSVTSVDGVDSVHGLKTRKSGPNIIIDAHIVVNPTMTVYEAHEITTNVEKKLREKFGKETYISLHIEPSENAE